MGLYGAYARLLRQLASRQFRQVTPEWRADIIAHFSGSPRLSRIKPDKQDRTRLDWARGPGDLQALEAWK